MIKNPFSQKNDGGEAADPTVGCPNCQNTGLEPGVPLSEAKECPVCHGSPFGEPGEEPVPVTEEEPQVETEGGKE